MAKTYLFDRSCNKMAGVITRLVSFKLKIKHKNKPKTIEKNQNNILLTWDNAFECDAESDSYILQMCNPIKQWITVYRGLKTRYRVLNLEPCTCYEFRIKLQNDKTNNWLLFKGATCEGPYFVMHLTRAVKLGNALTVRKIVQNSPYLLETENKDNKTPLVQAIDNLDLQMVQFLHSIGADINKPLTYNKRTPLMITIYLGYLEIAQFLITKGANITSVDINDLNILHYSVDSDNIENVEFALKTGVNVNAQDRSGWTPLLRAVILNCSKDIINLLITGGADKNICDNNGFNFDKHCELHKLL